MLNNPVYPHVNEIYVLDQTDRPCNYGGRGDQAANLKILEA